MKQILIGFEESQTICNEFRKIGAEAWSNDIKTPSGGHPEWHLKMDIHDAIDINEWDLIILHPPCTYTALSGNRWYAGTKKREEGIALCTSAWEHAKQKCKHVALEQPMSVMQKYIGTKTQKIQPWQFGHEETKETWLWLYNLPKLTPTKIVEAKENRIWKMPPSINRQQLRSKTYPGIAQAITSQWIHHI